ncbi:SDR family NAD(P)-dependent oxidoreductase [Paraburkholderia nodosa]|uniref:SDR family NAD(P)-dependent oxidoreductase n=1 Tax=Paraburkholderia nodosa TaxID=392320 RepID=UPI00048132E9|nr:SDR family NAD(P)-dependent oxidoreductase [Paraburkholderia nodosa]
MHRKLHHKIAVVTGAGAGRAVAEAFARAGYDVALLSREPERLARAAARLQAAYSGVCALAVPTDVADAQAVEAAAARVERELGETAVWVNVAMATIFAPLSSISPRDFERATHLVTPQLLRCTKSCDALVARETAMPSCIQPDPHAADKRRERVGARRPAKCPNTKEAT